MFNFFNLLGCSPCTPAVHSGLSGLCSPPHIYFSQKHKQQHGSKQRRVCSQIKPSLVSSLELVRFCCIRTRTNHDTLQSLSKGCCNSRQQYDQFIGHTAALHHTGMQPSVRYVVHYGTGMLVQPTNTC